VGSPPPLHGPLEVYGPQGMGWRRVFCFSPPDSPFFFQTFLVLGYFFLASFVHGTPDLAFIWFLFVQSFSKSGFETALPPPAYFLSGSPGPFSENFLHLVGGGAETCRQSSSFSPPAHGAGMILPRPVTTRFLFAAWTIPFELAG